MVKKNQKVEHKTKTTITKAVSEGERSAARHYKDLLHPQFNWDFKPPRNLCKGVGIDCCIVNNTLRGVIDYKSLSLRDRSNFNYIVTQLTNAINKSRVITNVKVLKGLSGSGWIEKMAVGDTFTDKAFGSFTTNTKIADKYAKRNHTGKRVYISQTLKRGFRALYLNDAGEEEYILTPNIKYIVRDITYSGSTIIYYVERT